MLKRPKNTDTMDDVLEQQREYNEKKNKSFQPAAKVISKNNTKAAGKSSLFARQRNIEKKEQNDSVKVSVISDIIERKYDSENLQEISFEPMDVDCGFPEVISISADEDSKLQNESVFASLMKNSNSSKSESNEEHKTIDEIKSTVDNENSELLKSMTPEQIMKEREELLKAMDPNLLKFLMEKRSKASTSKPEISVNVSEKDSHKSLDLKSCVENLPTEEILEEVNAYNYVNMNVIEPEKLEWLKSVDKIQCSIPKDKKYEARFDFKGFLLPYTFDDENSQKDNRELYCHEEESHRPGYTIQELFRLARAEVLQQRVTAISAICGILNMYMQGFYDGIIDLPISKIFFFLRFGLDENVSAIVEVCIKSLAYLFYNETDEILLDVIFETSFGFLQPLIIPNKSNSETKTIEESLENLTLNEKIFESKINDDDFLSTDDRDKESMTDFHLAEINLVESLERTNILERITYIIVVMKANQNTVISCLKILIRLARTCQSFAEKILQKRNLMEYLLSNNIISMETPKESEMTLKLFRIVASHNSKNFSKFAELSLFEKLASFISSQNDMKIQHIKLQIECFRFLRLYFRSCQNEAMFSSISLPLRYLLEWHIHHLDFHQSNHFLCRTHASALLYLIQTSNINVTYSLYGETIKMCCKKWFQRASSGNLHDISQSILLSCCLDVAGTFIKFIPEFYYDFINDYLIKFFKSPSFKNVTESLTKRSLFLNDFIDRRFSYKPLSNLGSIIRKKHNLRDPPNMIYPQDYAGYFINSLVMFIGLFKGERNEMNIRMFEKMKINFFNEGIERYLQKISLLKESLSISSNWFAQIETKLVYNLMKIDYYRQQPWIYKIAFFLLQNLTGDKFLLILDIFDNFIFHEDFSRGYIGKTELERMKYVYNGVVMSKIKKQQADYSFMVEGWNEIILTDTWVFELLLIFLHNVGIQSSDSKQIIETDLSEEEIITTTLKFKSYLNLKEINIWSHDEQLMYLMLIYLGKDLSFLNEGIKSMIRNELQTLKGQMFKFNVKLNKEKDFESLYKLFLETFQAQSYGDSTFSSIVVIPLMQKYDSKWRKIIWSEYAMILKFISCEENDLIYSIDDYLYPTETDESLLKCYRSTLKYLRKESLPWKIAVHHLNHTKS